MAPLQEHEHCSCVSALLSSMERTLNRLGELEEAQRQHVNTHRREALLKQQKDDRRTD